jgi:ALG3 protein
MVVSLDQHPPAQQLTPSVAHESKTTQQQPSSVVQVASSAPLISQEEHYWWHQYETPIYDYILIASLILLEGILSYIIVLKIPYTEIDYVAYMEQVTTFRDNHERDYYEIRGNTGPLVYPAGFLYIYSILKSVTGYSTHIVEGTKSEDTATTNSNANVNAAAIRMTQYIFLFFYCTTQLFVFLIYYTSTIRILQQQRQQQHRLQRQQTQRTPPTPTPSISRRIWTYRLLLILLCGSKRIHSIYMLRLFNDGITMLFLYMSMYTFIQHYYNIACVLFSIAVSIKMNVLLFAPGLLLLLLHVSNDLNHCIRRIIVYCGIPQLVMGLPFLVHHPIHYIHKAFEFDRVFFYQWTVNWKVCIVYLISSILTVLYRVSDRTHLLLFWFCYTTLVPSGRYIRIKTIVSIATIMSYYWFNLFLLSMDTIDIGKYKKHFSTTAEYIIHQRIR